MTTESFAAVQNENGRRDLREMTNTLTIVKYQVF